MINESLNTVEKLQAALIVAEAFISGKPNDTPYQDFEQRSVIYSSLIMFYCLASQTSEILEKNSG